jgi:hypothetical protein
VCVIAVPFFVAERLTKERTMDKPQGADKGADATIELPVLEEPTDEKPLTVADISDGSFNKTEIEAAKRHGLVVDNPIKDEKKAEEPPLKTEDKAPEPAPKSDDGKSDPFNLDEEKQAKFQEVFGQNQTVNKLYHRMKKERVKRQDLEAERDQILIQKKAAEDKAAELERRAAEEGRRSPKKDDLDLDELPTGDGADDGEKPLTRTDLAEIEREKAEKAAKEAGERNARLKVVNERLDDQQEDAKLRYKDFDKAMDLAADLMENLETLIPDRREQLRVSTKIRVALNAIANADKFSPDDYNGADMAYEIGLMHPKYKPGGTDQNADQGADLTPDKLNRIATNASRRSSATINGGASRRVVSVDNLTTADLAVMPSDQFRKLRKDRPDIVERLLRQ